MALKDFAGAVNTGAGAALGLLMQGQEDRRQIRQQKKLTAIQEESNERAAEANYGRQIRLFNETGVDAQLAQAEKAGLSKAGFLGGSGAGGSTAAAEASGVGMGNAADAASTQGANQGLALLTAQMKNIDAQTEKTKAETQKITGADTENLNTDTALKQAQAAFAEVQARLAGRNEEDTYAMVHHAAVEQMEKAREQFNKAQVSEETQRDVIKQIKAEAEGALIENAAKRQGIALDKAKIKEIAANISARLEEIKVSREGIEATKENMEKLTTTMLQQAGIQAAGNLVKNIVDLRTGKAFEKGMKQGQEIGKNAERIRQFERVTGN